MLCLTASQPLFASHRLFSSLLVPTPEFSSSLLSPSRHLIQSALKFSLISLLVFMSSMLLLFPFQTFPLFLLSFDLSCLLFSFLLLCFSFDFCLYNSLIMLPLLSILSSCQPPHFLSSPILYPLLFPAILSSRLSPSPFVSRSLNPSSPLLSLSAVA